MGELGCRADFAEGEAGAVGGLDVGGGFAEEVEVLDHAALEGEDADGDDLGFGHGVLVLGVLVLGVFCFGGLR